MKKIDKKTVEPNRDVLLELKQVKLFFITFILKHFKVLPTESVLLENILFLCIDNVNCILFFLCHLSKWMPVHGGYVLVSGLRASSTWHFFHSLFPGLPALRNVSSKFRPWYRSLVSLRLQKWFFWSLRRFPYLLFWRETYPQTFSPELLSICEYNSWKKLHDTNLSKMDIL